DGSDLDGSRDDFRRRRRRVTASMSVLDPSSAPVATAASLEVGIVVRDLDATTPFYRDALGLRHVADLPLPLGLQRRFACGGGIVKLMQLDEAPITSNPPGGITGGSTGLR